MPVQAIQLNLNNLRGHFKALAKLHHEQRDGKSNQSSKSNGAQSNSQKNSQSNAQSNLGQTNRRLYSIEEVNETDTALNVSSRTPLSFVSPVKEDDAPAPAPELENPQSDEVSKEVLSQLSEPPVDPVDTAASQIPQLKDESASQNPQSTDVVATSHVPQSNESSASQIPQSKFPSPTYAAEEAHSMSAVDSLDVMCDYMVMTINKGTALIFQK